MLVNLVFFCAAAFATIAATAAEPADIVLTGGKIYKVDAARGWAEAVAVSGERISFVGSDVDVARFIGENTQVIDLDGRMVLPGFQDSHIHPVSSALNSFMCSLFGLPTVDAYLQRIRECVAEHSNADWIHGAGWSHRLFPEGAKPTKDLLDEIALDIPVTLNSYDGHSLWANSKAMEVAGVDSDTPNVDAGEVVRYEGSREPTGLFYEDPAQTLIMSAKPAYSAEEVYGALQYVQGYLNSLGITSIQDALVDTDGDGLYGVLPTYQRAAASDELTLRVVGALYWDPAKGMEQVERIKELRESSSGGLFQATSVKIWYDGVMHTHTSKLLEAYADQPDTYGTSMVTPERLIELSVALDREGFQLHFHADGDRAIRESLDAVAAAIAANGTSDNRHHIAHLELIHPDDIDRFRELQVIANVQPMWSTSQAYIGDLIKVKIGEKRKQWLEINKSFLDHGVMTAYGSDWYVTSPNPMDLIEAAVTRIRPALPLDEKRTGSAPLPGENVSVADAIASYTINGAYLNHQETDTGSIEVGKYADIVVLDRNLFDVEQVRLSETKVLLTIMNGSIVYGELPSD